jgi:CheY-like chemotaxis protein
MSDVEPSVLTRFAELQSRFHLNYPNVDVVDVLQLLLPVIDAVSTDDISLVLANSEGILYQNLPAGAGFDETSLGFRYVFEKGEPYRASHLAAGCVYQVTTLPLRDAKNGINAAVSIVDGSQKNVNILATAMTQVGAPLYGGNFSETVLPEFQLLFGYEFALPFDVGSDEKIGDTPGLAVDVHDEIVKMVERLTPEGPSHLAFSKSGLWLRACRLDDNQLVAFGKKTRMTQTELAIQDCLIQLMVLNSILARRAPHAPDRITKDSEITIAAPDAFQLMRHYLKMLAASPDSGFIESAKPIIDGLRHLDRSIVGVSVPVDRIVRDLAAFYAAKGQPLGSLPSSIDPTWSITADAEDVVLAAQLVIRSVNTNSMSIHVKRHGDFVTFVFDLGQPVTESLLATAALVLDLWKINVFSLENGFAFTAELHSEPSREPSKVLERKKRSVLVVDDDDSLRDLLVDILKSRELTVYSCGEVPDALSLIDEKKPDIVISDYGLPRQSGAELARLVKKKNVATPFILITGWGSELQLTVDEQESINFILSKPFNLQEILETFDRCIQTLTGPK